MGLHFAITANKNQDAKNAEAVKFASTVKQNIVAKNVTGLHFANIKEIK
jgi:hypothetical protein